MTNAFSGAVWDGRDFASPAPANLMARLARSRRRSLESYRLDARSRAADNVLSGSQLSRLKERNEALLRVAVPGVDWLHRQLGDLGYCLLLTDASGATLEVRATGQRAVEFTSAGLRAGACWSEDTQGTCGVGTALADGEPVLVHGDQHFLVRNHGISCSAVPLFGPEQQLLGVLNATACTEDAQKLGQSLAYRLTLQTAARIEQSMFMSHFADHWIVSVKRQLDDWGADPDDLIAFDEGGRVVGVSRRLKHRLGNGAYFVDEILHRSVDGLVDFARAHPGTPMSLDVGSKNERLTALIRAPRKAPVHRSLLAAARPDTRSRADNDEMGIEGEHRLELLVNGKVPILLLGETGSGKEFTAKKIHSRSQRHDQPFVAINCAAIPETLIESELFGYRGGAFTGAHSKGCVGKIAQADGGMLFLDEIGDMPLALQTRLLRVLAEGEVLALGASKPQMVDISVICATHRDLGAMVREGRFREDLYYRLNAATVKLPPLRERKDIAELIRGVFAEECKTAGRHLTMSSDVLAGLVEHRWPGNIRELRNVLRYAIAVCPQAEMIWAHLPESFQNEVSDGVPDRRRAQLHGHVVTGQSSERDVILNAMQRTSWCVSAASRFLGISRSTLYRRLSEHGIDVTFRPGPSNTAIS
ncbi:acetoin catabolism protein [Parazoarcus communis]|uniref:Acetoin catabolism protein n=1 Tax=Parazoarcus communis TaxID=41977 RepID=A0A2U8H2V3_9RHOO|nr:sigma-54-dependent Fis family transcriptional regulator [Parazoarcus communis]AWI79506.1 acetoin catabolism protein [Parazoarcus communis]